MTRFIEGSPVSDEAVHRPETLRRVADSLRRIHDGPAIPGLFVPLRIVEAYRALAMARGVRIPVEYELAAAIGRRIELACLAAPLELAAVPQRPAQRELHRRRDADPDRRLGVRRDGRPLLRPRQLQHQPRADARRGRDPAGRLRRSRSPARRLARLTLMRVVSDFREAMWGVLQQGISTLDVDFVAYAGEHFDRLLANAATPAFERALDEVAGD